MCQCEDQSQWTPTCAYAARLANSPPPILHDTSSSDILLVMPHILEMAFHCNVIIHRKVVTCKRYFSLCYVPQSQTKSKTKSSSWPSSHVATTSSSSIRHLHHESTLLQASIGYAPLARAKQSASSNGVSFLYTYCISCRQASPAVRSSQKVTIQMISIILNSSCQSVELGLVSHFISNRLTDPHCAFGCET